MIERFSDSAAAYVLLDSANTAVYKQLYRAAKAKSKLKFRVTLKNTQEEKPAPQPVTVEDEPETASPTDSAVELKTEEAEEKQQEPATPDVPPPVPSPPAAGSETTLPLRNSTFSKVYNLTDLKNAAELAGGSQDALRQQFASRIQSLIERNAGLATHMQQQQEERRALSNSTPIQLAPLESQPPAPSPPACPATGATFAVCCNSCERTIPDAHYHCATCDDGDFDLCQSCVNEGISCYSTEHWLIKRTVVNGQFIHSTTETIAPKRTAKTSEKKEPAPKPASAPAPAPRATLNPTGERWAGLVNVRTCNSCIRGTPPPRSYVYLLYINSS